MFRLRGKDAPVLKPLDEFFSIVLCRLRRGFSEKHLGHLNSVVQSAVSQIFVQWINYIYLKFCQKCIWPSRDGNYADRFSGQILNYKSYHRQHRSALWMSSSLLLSLELFSSYKNHVTLQGLVDITPSGAITFISQLYTGITSGREIVLQSGLLSQKFEDNDSVMTDKGFQVQYILPLRVKLNIPPFLGDDSRMSKTVECLVWGYVWRGQ